MDNPSEIRKRLTQVTNTTEYHPTLHFEHGHGAWICVASSYDLVELNLRFKKIK
jgi:hypothetical protein